MRGELCLRSRVNPAYVHYMHTTVLQVHMIILERYGVIILEGYGDVTMQRVTP